MKDCACLSSEFVCKCTWVHVIFGVDKSGPHTGKECVCLMGVVFGVQSLTFFFFFTCNTLRNTRRTEGLLLCNVEHSYTDTFSFIFRGKVCSIIVTQSSATRTGTSIPLWHSLSDHVRGRATALWDYKVQTGWPTRWHSRPHQNWFTVTT